MAQIKVTPLGAGETVGKRCFLLSIGRKNIMLDCGMDLGFKDERMFPDFSYIVPEGQITSHIDCVIISHFHLDHCGALPYITEIIGYSGPIYMTHPTKAIAPVLLEDMKKSAFDQKGNSFVYTSQMIKDCMKKVTGIPLYESVMIGSEIEIKAYYAGHALGAAMFWIRVGFQSVVYTGDYNMTADRHLGAAWIDNLKPDLLISEATLRNSRPYCEKDFLKKVHGCVACGGKVLIPVFALEKAQKLCILLETYWDRMNLKYPIYFAMGSAENANSYYKMFVAWANQKNTRNPSNCNVFDFKCIKTFDRGCIDDPGSMIVFATPGMLHTGLSLQIFKKWASNENNMLVIPGYCVQGTVGHKILCGAKKVTFENNQIVEIKMSVEFIRFNTHSDENGILKLIQNCEPRNVLLVHGDEIKLKHLKEKIRDEYKIDCFLLCDGETKVITTPLKIPLNFSVEKLKNQITSFNAKPPDPKHRRFLHGILVMKEGKLTLMDLPGVFKENTGKSRHALNFASYIKIEMSVLSSLEILQNLYLILKEKLSNWDVEMSSQTINIERVAVVIVGEEKERRICITWNNQDEDLGRYIFGLLQSIG
ncbi:CLUMA_CG004139, isoform A [Clunio marinus]|uniref:Integrator complex subunit 11 n=1 Tax=Clunio marinus TaxID=568069 RepID=A0A1J1HV89_9DIPT|nr:CLUMA_CG004139, isoform A [Clunio marinus]